MLRENLVTSAATVKPSAASVESILRSVRAARQRIEDEGRDFSDWGERDELAGLLTEAITDLQTFNPPAIAATRADIINEVIAALRAADGIGSWQEAVAAVRRMDGAPSCACLGLLCAGESFECGQCFRELPACERVDDEEFPLCGDCWTAARQDIAGVFNSCDPRPFEREEVAA